MASFKLPVPVPRSFSDVQLDLERMPSSLNGARTAAAVPNGSLGTGWTNYTTGSVAGITISRDVFGVVRLQGHAATTGSANFILNSTNHSISGPAAEQRFPIITSAGADYARVFANGDVWIGSVAAAVTWVSLSGIAWREAA